MSIIIRKDSKLKEKWRIALHTIRHCATDNGILWKVRVRCSAIEMSEERYQSFRDLTQYQLRETAIIFITGAKKEKERKYAKDAEREKKKSKKISHNYTTKGN